MLGRRIKLVYYCHYKDSDTNILKNQFGFTSERPTNTEAIHLIRTFMNHYKDRENDFQMAFKDLEKANDRKSRRCDGDPWRRLSQLHISKLLKIGMMKCELVKMLGQVEHFSINIKLHLGYALSRFLFNFKYHYE